MLYTMLHVRTCHGCQVSLPELMVGGGAAAAAGEGDSAVGGRRAAQSAVSPSQAALQKGHASLSGKDGHRRLLEWLQGV